MQSMINASVYDPDVLWIYELKRQNPEHFSEYRIFKTYMKRMEAYAHMIEAGYISVFSTYTSEMNFVKNIEFTADGCKLKDGWQLITIRFSQDGEENSRSGDPGMATPVDLELDGFAAKDDGSQNVNINVLAHDFFTTSDVVNKLIGRLKLLPIIDPDSLKTDWAFIDGKGSIQTAEMEIKPPIKIASCLYPFIHEFDTFVERYAASSAPILILLGPPGMGKTTFIRYLLHKLKWRSMLAYEPSLMIQDSYYLQFVQNNNNKCMILEDADILLQSRIDQKNPVMSKLLNVSDGLLQFNKKFIFTANISNINDIDHALSRPGRCFDVINFRELSGAEAQKVATEFNLPFEDTKDSYTLAELFNNKNDGHKAPVKQRMGFLE